MQSPQMKPQGEGMLGDARKEQGEETGAEAPKSLPCPQPPRRCMCLTPYYSHREQKLAQSGRFSRKCQVIANVMEVNTEVSHHYQHEP